MTSRNEPHHVTGRAPRPLKTKAARAAGAVRASVIKTIQRLRVLLVKKTPTSPAPAPATDAAPPTRSTPSAAIATTPETVTREAPSPCAKQATQAFFTKMANTFQGHLHQGSRDCTRPRRRRCERRRRRGGGGGGGARSCLWGDGQGRRPQDPEPHGLQRPRELRPQEHTLLLQAHCPPRGGGGLGAPPSPCLAVSCPFSSRRPSFPPAVPPSTPRPPPVCPLPPLWVGHHPACDPSGRLRTPLGLIPLPRLHTAKAPPGLSPHSGACKK